MLEKLFKISSAKLKNLVLYNLNPYGRDSKIKETLFTSFLIMALAFILIFIMIILSGAWIDPSPLNNTYATGTRYSTIKLKDFDKG